MSQRPTKHLKSVVAEHGEPDGTADMMAIIGPALRAINARRQAARDSEAGRLRVGGGRNPSISMAGKCARQTAFKLMDLTPSNPPDDDSLMRFEVGHAFEAAIALMLVESQGCSFVAEQPREIRYADTVIRGRSDFSAVRVLDPRGSIVELKSTNARAMAWLLKAGKPQDDHVKQLRLYMHAEYDRDNPSPKRNMLLTPPPGYLVYCVAGSTKGEPILHAWKVPYDRAAALADRERLAVIDQIARQRKAPAIDADHTSKGSRYWECGYCDFRDLCRDAFGLLAISVSDSIYPESGARGSE